MVTEATHALDLSPAFGLVWIWDIVGKTHVVLDGHTDRVSALAFSPGGMWLASSSADGTARLWDADNGEEVVVLAGYLGAVRVLAYSPDGGLLASGGRHATARLWDATTGEQVLILAGHSGAIAALAFSPDGTQLGTCDHDHTRLWNVESGKELASFDSHVESFAGHADQIPGLAFSPDSTRLAIPSQGSEIVLLPTAVLPAACTRVRRYLAYSRVAVILRSTSDVSLTRGALQRGWLRGRPVHHQSQATGGTIPSEATFAERSSADDVQVWPDGAVSDLVLRFRGQWA